MLASERLLPPNQIGRWRTRSLTTLRWLDPLRIEISSMPITVGPGECFPCYDPSIRPTRSPEDPNLSSSDFHISITQWGF
jgi:hypothetical protein